MVSSVPSDKAHQAGLVDTIGLQVVYSGAFGSTSQVLSVFSRVYLLSFI